MSALGQKRTFGDVRAMSALPPKADIGTHPQKWIRQTSIYLIRVARSDIAGDLGAFFQITANNDIGGWRATAIGLFKPAIAAIEARDHQLMAVSARRFGVDQ